MKCTCWFTKIKKWSLVGKRKTKNASADKQRGKMLWTVTMEDKKGLAVEAEVKKGQAIDMKDKMVYILLMHS